MLLAVLNNQPGAARDIVQLNAGAAIYVADLVTTLKEGVSQAAQVIANGAAKNKLAQCLGASEKERILDWYIPELVKGGKLRRVMDKKIQREARYYWVA